MGPDEHHRKMDSLLTKHFADDTRIQNQILEKLEAIENGQASMMDMLATYNNVKGFAATMKAVSVLLAWLVFFAGTLSAVGYAIKQWMRS